MPRLTTIIAVIGVGILLLSGVIEVSVHPGKIGNIPGVVSNAGSGNFGQIGRVATSLKRQGEIFFTDSPTKRLQKHLSYIETDATELQEHFNAPDTDPEAILAQAAFLVRSLDSARQQAATIDPEQLVSLQEQSDTAVGSAKQALVQLYQLREEYQFNTERLTEITSSVELNLGELADSDQEGSDSEETGEVAGANNETPDEEDPEDASQSIPLRF